MRQRAHAIDPITRLAIAFRAAAAGIEHPVVRNIAARKAESIPRSRMEMGRHHKADMARHGRLVMRQLPTMPADMWDEARRTLRACADAIISRFEETDSEILGRPRRHPPRLSA